MLPHFHPRRMGQVCMKKLSSEQNWKLSLAWLAIQICSYIFTKAALEGSH
jgi:hypothetical protein